MEYEMFSFSGNRMVSTRVKRLCKYINAGKKITPEIITKKFNDLLIDVSKKHKEVYDTEPQYHIKSQIKKCLKDNYFDVNKFF